MREKITFSFLIFLCKMSGKILIKSSKKERFWKLQSSRFLSSFHPFFPSDYFHSLLFSSWSSYTSVVIGIRLSFEYLLHCKPTSFVFDILLLERITMWLLLYLILESRNVKMWRMEEDFINPSIFQLHSQSRILCFERFTSQFSFYFHFLVSNFSLILFIPLLFSLSFIHSGIEENVLPTMNVWINLNIVIRTRTEVSGQNDPRYQSWWWSEWRMKRIRMEHERDEDEKDEDEERW